MKTESHASVVKSEVRRGALARHAALRLGSGRALLVVGGIGLPRSWSISVGAVVDGFTRALESSDERGEKRLTAALAATDWIAATHGAAPVAERSTSLSVASSGPAAVIAPPRPRGAAAGRARSPR